MNVRKYPAVVFVVCTAVLLITADEVFARAGGGGGHGSGGTGGLIIKIILLPILLIAAAIRAKNIREKKEASEEIIRQAAAEDAFWNEDKMVAHAKNVFYKMQTAWSERSMAQMRAYLSDDLYQVYTSQLDLMKANHEKNLMEGISVSQISIISAEDYKDNSRDAFVAYIAGKMTDYTVNELTGKVIKNRDKESESFSDTYHFIRRGNNWLLYDINNKVTLEDIKSSQNYKE